MAPSEVVQPVFHPPGTATRAAERVVVRVSVVVLGGTIILLGLVLSVWPAGRSAFPWGPAAVVVVAGLLAAWSVEKLSGAVFFALVAVICFASIAIATLSTAPAPPRMTLVGWPVLAGMTASMVLNRRLWRWIVVGCALGMLVLTAALLRVDAVDLRFVVVATVSVLTFGMTFGRTVDALLSAGRHADDAASAAADAAADTDAAEVLAEESFRLSRMLHDGIVNTLGAIRLGSSLSMLDIRERCRRDVADIERIRTADPIPIPTMRHLVDRAVSKAELHGIGLQVIRLGKDPDLPVDVLEAISGALDEAILNAHKHGRATRATLIVDAAETTIRVVLVDEGEGIREPLTPRVDGGIERSIHLRCAAAGIASSIERVEPHGTKLTMSYRPAPVEPEHAPRRNALSTALVVIAFELSFWLMVRLLAVVPLDWDGAPAWWWLTELGLMALGTGIGIVAMRRWGPLRWWACLPMIAIVAVIAGLRPNEVMTCSALGEGLWQPTAAAAVVMAVVLLTRGLGWTIAAALTLSVVWGQWLIASQFVYHCRTGLGAFVVFVGATVAMWLIREQILRFGRQAQRSLDLMQASRKARAAAVSRQQARRKMWSIALTTGIPLLRDIAEGRRDPHSDDVRAEAALTESLLRNCSQLDIGLGPLEGTLLDVCQVAAGRGIRVDLQYGEPPSPAGPVLDELHRILLEVVQVALPTSRIEVTALTRDAQSTLTCAFVTSRPPRFFARTPGLGIDFDGGQDDEQSLLTLTWNRTVDPDEPDLVRTGTAE